jgi:hypothetical protein
MVAVSCRKFASAKREAISKELDMLDSESENMRAA